MALFETMRKTLAGTLQRIDEIEAQYKALDAKRKRLETLKMIEGSPYWHGEKYLYVIGRTKGGYRPREYIGNKPENVDAAMQAMERFETHKKTIDEMQELKNQVTAAQFLLQQCSSMLIRGR